MGLASFSRRILGLQAVFPSSGQQVAQPDAIDGTVQPVYLYPGNAASLDRAQRLTQVSNSAVQPSMTVAAIAQGFYDEWLVANIFHSSVENIQLALNLVDPGGLAVQMGRFIVDTQSSLSIVGNTASSGNPQQIPFRIWVPPGFSVQIISITVAAVAFNFTLQRVAVLHPLAEPPVWP